VLSDCRPACWVVGFKVVAHFVRERASSPFTVDVPQPQTACHYPFGASTAREVVEVVEVRRRSRNLYRCRRYALGRNCRSALGAESGQTDGLMSLARHAFVTALVTETGGE
jgi:hypothetical protein